jgi:hypothetical protein
MLFNKVVNNVGFLQFLEFFLSIIRSLCEAAQVDFLLLLFITYGSATVNNSLPSFSLDVMDQLNFFYCSLLHIVYKNLWKNPLIKSTQIILHTDTSTYYLIFDPKFLHFAQITISFNSIFVLLWSSILFQVLPTRLRW